MAEQCKETITSTERITVLLHEYDALYGLVTFRMSSLDRRAPLEGATLVAILGAVSVLPPPARHVFLTAVPLALVWFFRTTINHVRSFEDILSRLAEIERLVNRATVEDLLQFQSRHPSRDFAVGGRTGRETVLSVYYTCLVLLGTSAYLAYAWASDISVLLVIYWGLLGIEAGYLTRCLRKLVLYRYEKLPPADPGAERQSTT